MCGIIGYCGPLDAQTVLLNGLTQLEYRGYDSAGIALFDENSKIHFIKKVGKVAALRKVCEEDPIVSHCGIGHIKQTVKSRDLHYRHMADYRTFS